MKRVTHCSWCGTELVGEKCPTLMRDYAELIRLFRSNT